MTESTSTPHDVQRPFSDPAVATGTAVSTRILVPAIALGALGLYMAALTPQIVTLSIRIAQVHPDGKTAALSTTLLVGALLSVGTLPVFGALSDRTRGRYGRRRPWLVGGALVGFLGLVITGTAGSLTGVLVGYSVASVGSGAAFAGFLPLIPELVPPRILARLSGLMGLMITLAVLVGITLGSVLVDRPALMIGIPGAVALGSVIILARVVRRVDRPSTALWPPFGLKQFLGSYWLRADNSADFKWNWASRLLVGLAFVGMQSYATYFLTDTAGLSVPDAAAQYAKMVAMTTPLSVIFFLLAGFLSDRLGKRKVFVVTGAVLMAMGLTAAAFAQTVGSFMVGWVILSVGLALYTTVDIAIAAAVVPDEAQAGKAMSVYQVATLLPNIGAPLVAVVVLALTGGANYRAFFLTLAALAVVAALAVFPIRRIR